MTSTHINNFWKDFENPQNLGFFIGAWNIGTVIPLPEFSQRMEVLVQEIKACPPSPGCTEVFYPGEIEHRRAQESIRNGIALGPAVVDDLKKLGEEYSVSFP